MVGGGLFVHTQREDDCARFPCLHKMGKHPEWERLNRKEELITSGAG